MVGAAVCRSSSTRRRGSPSIGSDGVWKAERLGLKMYPETGAQRTECVAWRQARTPPVAGISAAVILRDRAWRCTSCHGDHLSLMFSP